MPSRIKRLLTLAAVAAFLALLSMAGEADMTDAKHLQNYNCDMVADRLYPAEMCPMPRVEPSTRIAMR